MPRRVQPIAISMALALSLAVTQGLGLLSVPLILPSMMIDLGWDFRHAGFFASASFAGLAAGLIISQMLAPYVTTARLFQFGIVFATAMMIATGATRDVYALGMLRFISGVAAGPVLLGGFVLASSIYVFEPDSSRRMLAIFRAGASMGLIGGGLLLPLLLDALGPRGWPEAWFTLGLIGSACLPFGFWASQRIVVLRPPPSDSIWPYPHYSWALAAYALFAAGLSMMLTFIVLHAQQQGATALAVVALWMTIGLAGLLAPLGWRALPLTLTPNHQVATTIGVTVLGALIVTAGLQPATVVFAAALLGFGAFMVNVTLSQLVEESLPAERRPNAHASLLLVSAVGQAAGPLAAGHLAAHSGTLDWPMGIATVCLMIAAGIALLLPIRIGRPPHEEARSARPS